MNVGVQVPVQVPTFDSLGYIPRIEFLDHMVILCLLFLRNLLLVFANEVLLKHYHAPLSVLPKVAFVLQWQSLVVVTEVTHEISHSLKYLLSGTFQKKSVNLCIISP